MPIFVCFLTVIIHGRTTTPQIKTSHATVSYIHIAQYKFDIIRATNTIESKQNSDIYEGEKKNANNK